MASDDRFYRLSFRHRPVFHGDVGSALRIQGLVVGGGGVCAVLMLPGMKMWSTYTLLDELTDEDWSDFIRCSDDPEILVGPAKIFQRKLRWAVSGAVQQRVWAADGFQCRYCGRRMGQAKLTIDHFVPLESGGVNDETNYLTACVACNKDKGGEDPGAWCARRGLDPSAYATYLKERRI